MNRNARNRGRGGLLARAISAIRGGGTRRAAGRSAGRTTGT